MFLALALTHIRFGKDFVSGLGTAVFFLVTLPIECRIEMPGALPQLTVHRLILLLMIFHVSKNKNISFQRMTLPGVKLLLVIGLGRIFSMFIGLDFVMALKDLLSLCLETILFYVLIGKCLDNRDTVIRVFWSIIYASLVVGFIAWIEKYRGINIADRLIPGADNEVSVTATYRHRILLGYAMALPLPMTLGLLGFAKSKLEKRASFLAMLIFPGACYFANSRGPWAGAAAGVGIMTMTAGKVLRKRLIWMAALVAVVLIARPGVYDSLYSKWHDTGDTDSLKGRSAAYRKELWKVAFMKITESSERFVFGYGGGSTELMQLGEFFEFGGGSSNLGFTSWDGELAADTVKFGMFGLVTESLLYIWILLRSIALFLGAPKPDKPLLASCIAVSVIFIWALTNVAIFNPQLTFLYWTVAAFVMRFPYLADKPATALARTVEASDEPSLLEDSSMEETMRTAQAW
jgi:hypothetical protein